MKLADVVKYSTWPSAETLKKIREAEIAEARRQECLRLGITDEQLDILLDAAAHFEAAGVRGVCSAYDALASLIQLSPLTASEVTEIEAKIKTEVSRRER